MTTESNHKKSKLEGRITLAGSLIVVVALLVYFLPRETKFGYEYEQGRPWRYNSLIATFDFPIYKTRAEVEEEQDSALRQFMPFFSEDKTIGQRQINAFRSDFMHGEFKDVPARYLPHIEQKLSEVYSAGIVAAEQLSKMAQELTPGIRLVQGTEAISRPLGELYSTRSAYELIMHADTVAFPREVMARCNLNKYLEPNLLVDSMKTTAAREDVLASVSPASGMVQSGQRIIDRGEIVSAEQYQILKSFEHETLRRNDPSEGFWWIMAGQIIFVSCVLAAFALYLRLFRRDYLRSPHSILLLTSLIAIFPIITYLMVDH